MKVLVVFYSMYGHIYQMAQAAVKGVHEVPGAQVELKQIPETLPDEVLAKMGALEARKGFAHIPTCTVEELASYDAIFFGVPTRFGNMCGQMRQFLDATGSLWAKNALVGKVGSVFTSSGTQHGGQESTILSFHTTLLHLGMIIVGLPYSFELQKDVSEITGCSPYGASTIVGPDGSRMPSTHELTGTRYQARHAATIAMKLFG
ncbi:MAG TPA: NAD(P)H:quinone oxidoreductase [Deltaproteobacteria bacterium]|nr:NAD(P)H:quinone oxidoreductase [Deltaproteobacteria bacterium]HPR55808.1 NAD(P)H:quinone oxidoreductase [Deltaproteobacteria bacterium]HXK46074.1 NAD(P)H:quinone oxidoreductase [Deltaproteobacteria bacterium]